LCLKMHLIALESSLSCCDGGKCTKQEHPNTLRCDKYGLLACKTWRGDLKPSTRLGNRFIRYAALRTPYDQNCFGNSFETLWYIVFSSRSWFFHSETLFC
jgi:hypothetical protein